MSWSSSARIPSGDSVISAWRGVMPAQLVQLWGEAETRPMVVLGAGLQLLWSNSAADEAMREAVDVALNSGTFRLVDPAEMTAFARFLGGAKSPVSAWCSRQADGGAMVFRASRIEDGDQIAHGVAFHLTGKRYVPHWADFSRMFGLTATEFRVARRLLDGQQVEAIAMELNIAAGTARIHVRNLYAKLEVSSREAMFRLLLPFHLA